MIDTAVTRTRVPEDKRTSLTAALFGNHYAFTLEPAVFSIAGMLAPKYSGALWTMYSLGNGGFVMHPETDHGYDVVCPNDQEGHLSAEALGIVACLYAYSHLSFSARRGFAAVCAEHYHLLRAFAAHHPEADAIMRAID